MLVREIRLKHFRNLGDLRFTPEPRLNFILGENGQGKTSILEGLSTLSTLRSFRGAKNQELVKVGETWAEASATVGDRPDWSTELKITFAQAGERVARTAFIDGKPIRSSTQYLSSRFGNVELGFHSIVFNPSDHDLIRGEPALRRGYLDRALSAEDPEYLKTLSRYAKILEQRNALLKLDARPTESMLEGFTAPLVEMGARIVHARLGWLARLEKILGETLRKTVPGALPLRAFYLSSWIKKNEGISISSVEFDPARFALQNPLPALEFFEAEFREALSVKREAEWRAGVTLAGPHRDDLALFYGAQPLRGHGSQGETRSALIALKLCEIELFRSKTGHRPILLLDDFSSELDRGRREYLLRTLFESDLQVFVTSTEEPPFAGKIFRVKQGALEIG
ncbi:MAG: DNA replication/repair protein RecF [Bdellovibrionales bacterium]|nr:DNA replication/repair protein RecF [Bdellovibrionales bacterium]